MAKRSVFTLSDVQRFLRKLVSKHNDELYAIDDDYHLVLKDDTSYKGDVDIFPHPFRELFLWAVLSNRYDMQALHIPHTDP